MKEDSATLPRVPIASSRRQGLTRTAWVWTHRNPVRAEGFCFEQHPNTSGSVKDSGLLQPQPGAAPAAHSAAQRQLLCHPPTSPPGRAVTEGYEDSSDLDPCSPVLPALGRAGTSAQEAAQRQQTGSRDDGSRELSPSLATGLQPPCTGEELCASRDPGTRPASGTRTHFARDAVSSPTCPPCPRSSRGGGRAAASQGKH